MIPLFVFYTKDTPYEEAAGEFLSKYSRRNLQLLFDLTISGKKSRGSWEANCNIKSEYILAAAQTGQPFIYIDIDARIERPEFVVKAFNEFVSSGAAIGAHFKDGTELLSGTLFINPSAASDLLLKWVEISQQVPGVWDQKNLHEAIKQTDTLPHLLDPELTFIFDSMAKANPGMAGAIIHYQYSRKLRRAVNKGMRHA